MPSAALKLTNYDDDQNLQSNEQPLTVGSILMQARQSRNEALEKISDRLRISENYLIALESDDRARLPENVYTIGFLRTYSLYLSLDAESIIAQFKQQFTQSVVAETLIFPAPAPERSIPTSTLVAIASGLALLIMVVWLYLKPNQITVDNSQNKSESLTIEAEETDLARQENPATDTEIKTEYSQAYPIFPIPDSRPYEETRAAKIQVIEDGIYLEPGKSFTILSKAESWVEIKDSKGNVLLSKTLKAGESHELMTQEKLSFSTGNAAGISFYVNGKYFSELGNEGEIIKAKTLFFSAKESTPNN